jgi:soluble lytic murein transglycosylase-like protein
VKQFVNHLTEFGKRTIITLTPFLVYYVAVLIFLSPVVSNLFSSSNEQQIKSAITRKILTEYCNDKKLAGLFIKVGKLYDIDPFFLYSVANASSQMQADKVTERAGGAKLVGLMQINSKDYTKYSPKNLFDSEINLKLGAKELRKAMDYGKGHMIKTLAVYHADDLTSQNAKYGQATLDYIENVRKSYSDIQRSEKLYIQENYDLFSKERNIQQ